MKTRPIRTIVATLTVGGMLTATLAAAGSPESISTILAKLDQLLAAVNNVSVDLRPVAQNWDKSLPTAGGGGCPDTSTRYTCVLAVPLSATMKPGSSGSSSRQVRPTRGISVSAARALAMRVRHA
jgi:hypothetical protein